MLSGYLREELHQLETETFEIEECTDVGMDALDAVAPVAGPVASNCSCSTSSCCSSSTSTGSTTSSSTSTGSTTSCSTSTGSTSSCN